MNFFYRSVHHAAHARRVVLQNEAERLELIWRKSILIVLNYFECRLALRVFDVSIGAIEEQLLYNQLVFNEDSLSLVDRFSRVVPLVRLPTFQYTFESPLCAESCALTYRGR